MTRPPDTTFGQGRSPASLSAYRKRRLMLEQEAERRRVQEMHAAQQQMRRDMYDRRGMTPPDEAA